MHASSFNLSFFMQLPDKRVECKCVGCQLSSLRLHISAYLLYLSTFNILSYIDRQTAERGGRAGIKQGPTDFSVSPVIHSSRE